MQAIPKELTDEEWKAFGYPTTEPCDICGEVSEGGNKLEPRFYYSTCRKDAGVAPVLRSAVREAHQRTGRAWR